MNVLFYAHNSDLDHIDAKLTGKPNGDYTIEVFTDIHSAPSIVRKSLILVSLSYESYLKVREILKFA